MIGFYDCIIMNLVNKKENIVFNIFFWAGIKAYPPVVRVIFLNISGTLSNHCQTYL